MPTDAEPQPEVVAAVPQGQPDELLSAVSDLVARREQVIPLVGAGLAVAAGAPSSAELVEQMMGAAGADVQPRGLFEVADVLEQRRGTAWVQETVADLVGARQPTATGTLRVLTGTPNRIIATTNYDDAIEVAARAMGLQPRSFWGPRLNEGLRRPARGILHVLHLHGHHGAPGSLVLTEASYAAAMDDPALVHVLHALASEHVLVFLGHSLDRRERHIIDGLVWSSDTFAVTGRHYLVLDEQQAQVRPDLAALRETTTVVAPFRNADGTYEAVTILAELIGQGLPADRDALANRAADRLHEPHVPLPIAPASEVEDDDRRSAWELFSSVFKSRMDVEDLLRHNRVLLYGAPGSGKTQTLLHAGRTESTHRAVYVRLGTVQVWGPAADPIREFVSWVANGESFTDGIPRPTPERLADSVYLFLLDGLDEVRRGDRAHVFGVIGHVAERHPHLLFVVASRRYQGGADLDERGFEVLELVPDQSWFREFIETQLADPRLLEKAVPPGYPLQDLLRRPIFARAVVDAARQRRVLPTSPTDAILEVARAALYEEGPTLFADADAVDRWLDGLAFVAEARHSSQLDAKVVLDRAVASRYGIQLEDRFLDRLVERVLVIAAGDAVQFPANIVQEARAARALRTASRPLELLEAHVLVEHEDGVAGIHPSWRNTIELYCHDSPAHVRTRLAEFDRRLVARATPISAGIEERQQALQTLLGFYDDHLVWWIDSEHHGQLRDDLDAIATLAGDPSLHTEAVAWAGARLDHDERTLRGNAVRLLARLGGDAAELLTERMSDLLGDDDAVVLRLAVAAHEQMELDGHAATLRQSLESAPDNLAERALLGAWIRTAPDDSTVVEWLIERWPAEMDSWAATSALDRRFTRLEQLDVLAAAPRPPDDWVDHIVDGASSSDDGTAWGDEEVKLLADLVYGDERRTRRLSHKARPVLRRHLAAALPAVWAHGEEHATLLLYQAADIELVGVLDHALPDPLREVVEAHLTRRRTATSGEDLRPHVVADKNDQDPAGRVAEAVDRGWPAVADLPPHMLDGVLAGGDESGLFEVAAQEWDTRLEQPGGPVADITRVDDHRIHDHRGVLPLLRVGARARLPLDRTTWFALLRLGWFFDGLQQWLVEELQDEWLEELEEQIDELDRSALRLAADVVPAGRISPSAAIALAQGLGDADEMEMGALASYVERLVTAGRDDVLEHLHEVAPSEVTLQALARTGDCDAELQLLETHLESSPPDQWQGRYGDPWLDHLSCKSSVDILIRRIKESEAVDADHGYRSSLHNALGRAAGAGALRIYDLLIDERPYPDAHFLWFRRSALLDRLLSQSRQPIPQTTAAVRGLVVELVAVT